MKIPQCSDGKAVRCTEQRVHFRMCFPYFCSFLVTALHAQFRFIHTGSVHPDAGICHCIQKSALSCFSCRFVFCRLSDIGDVSALFRQHFCSIICRMIIILKNAGILPDLLCRHNDRHFDFFHQVQMFSGKHRSHENDAVNLIFFENTEVFQLRPGVIPRICQQKLITFYRKNLTDP